MLPLAAFVLLAQRPPLDAPAPRPPIHGRLLDELNAPLAHWSVAAETSCVNLASQLSRGNWTLQTTTDSSGRFTFDPAPGPAFLLVLRPPDESFAVVREDFLLESEIVLRLRTGDRPSSFVEAVLLGPGGRSLEDAELSTSPEFPWSYFSAERTGDRFRLGPLPPGEHLLRATAPECPPIVFSRHLGPDATLDLGLLTFERPGWIEIDLRDERVARASDERVISRILSEGVHGCGHVYSGALPSNEGMCGLAALIPRPPIEVGRSTPLAPGRYLLRTIDRRWHAPDRFVDVVADRATSVVLTLEPATTRTFAVRVPSRDPSTRASLRVESRDGSIVREEECIFRKKDSFVLDVYGLPLGHYRIEARTPAGLRREYAYEVTSLADDYRPTELVLD